MAKHTEQHRELSLCTSPLVEPLTVQQDDWETLRVLCVAYRYYASQYFVRLPFLWSVAIRTSNVYSYFSANVNIEAWN